MPNRRPLRQTVQKQLHFTRLNHTGQHMANTLNMSHTGLLIETPNQLKLGEVLEILLSYPHDGKTVTIEGQCLVIRVVTDRIPSRVGLKFINKLINSRHQATFSPIETLPQQGKLAL